MREKQEEETEQTDWTPKVEKLLQEWHKRVYAAQTAYYEEAERFKRWNYRLGIPVVIVSSLVGTAVFADVGSRWLVGSVSLMAAVMASLQTFLKFGENATLHGSAADWFSAIRRDIEQLLALPPNLRGKPKSALDGIRQEMNRAGQKSPELSEHLWRRVSRHFGVEEPPYALRGRQEEDAEEEPEPDFRPNVKRKVPRDS
jgi:hypothetical protein